MRMRLYIHLIQLLYLKFLKLFLSLFIRILTENIRKFQ